jgi:hypothetical protein
MDATESTMRECYHCSHSFNPEDVTPVLIIGAQSYNGHLLTGKISTRAVYLCDVCLPNLMRAHIEGMRVELDEERQKQRGPIPRMQALSDEEMPILIGYGAICTGVGACQDSGGFEDRTRRLTHEAYDTQDRPTPYCYHHARRAYEFELYRWRDRQRVVR